MNNEQLAMNNEQLAMNERPASDDSFVGSLVRSCVGSLVRWFVGSLVRWFVRSFIRWSLVRHSSVGLGVWATGVCC